jgi:hypothetical protein
MQDKVVELSYDVARIVEVLVAPLVSFLSGLERTEEPIANQQVAATDDVLYGVRHVLAPE